VNSGVCLVLYGVFAWNLQVSLIMNYFDNLSIYGFKVINPLFSILFGSRDIGTWHRYMQLVRSSL